MTYAVIHHFAGATKEQYDASIAAVHPDGLPPGHLTLAAGPSEGGWNVIATLESKEHWETFRDTVLMPQMQAGIPGGFTTPPVETSFEVMREMTG